MADKPESLFELLAAAGIRLRATDPGRTEHVRCPKCEGGREGEISLSVTIDADGEGATWVCHRGSCGWKDGGRIQHAPRPQPTARVHQTPPRQPEDRPDWLYQAFAARCIGARTLHQLGIYATERAFPHPIGRSPAIVFPYRHNDELVNRKYRPHPAKNPMMQERDALPTLFNVDALGDSPDEIVWVEGEMDVAAMVECGINHAVTLKDGAPATLKPETDPNAKRFEALRTHADVIAKARRIILAGDADAPGIALREELARRLGRHRCHLVTWPNGRKDAGEVLQHDGPDAVTEAVRAAEPYPIDGLQRIRPTTLLALREIPPPAVMTTGTEGTDNILKLPTEGRLIVVTGFPGSGKTNWVRFVMIHTADHHHRRWAVFSPEMQPWEHFAAECAEVWSGKPFWPMGTLPSMTDDEVLGASVWLRDKLTMLVCDAEEQAPTIDWIIEHARIAVARDGVTDLLIDPWNEIDHTRPLGVTETDYIGRSLQRLKAFGLRHGCNIWLIAHPAKPQPAKGSDKGAAPGPYDISGSSNWFNRADIGITVHSPHSGAAEIHLWKARFVRRWGKRGAMANLEFDPIIGRYSTPAKPFPEGPPPDLWQDTDR